MTALENGPTDAHQELGFGVFGLFLDLGNAAQRE